MSMGNEAQVGRIDIPLGGIPIDFSNGDMDLVALRPRPARGVYVATAGNLEVDLAEGDHVIYANLNAGQDYPRGITKIYQAGTTITGVVHF